MLHELLQLVLPGFITSCSITPVYDDRAVRCAITHFPLAYIENNTVAGNAINIRSGKSHINQLRRVTEKTPLTVPGWDPRGSPPGSEMRFGRHYLSVLSLIPMIDLGPRWAPGSSSWFKTNYMMMISLGRRRVWCVWFGGWREQDKSPNSVGGSALCSVSFLSLSFCVSLCFMSSPISFLPNQSTRPNF